MNVSRRAVLLGVGGGMCALAGCLYRDAVAVIIEAEVLGSVGYSFQPFFFVNEQPADRNNTAPERVVYPDEPAEGIIETAYERSSLPDDFIFETAVFVNGGQLYRCEPVRIGPKVNFVRVRFLFGGEEEPVKATYTFTDSEDELLQTVERNYSV